MTGVAGTGPRRARRVRRQPRAVAGLLVLATLLAGALGADWPLVLTDAAEELARKLSTLTPATLCALYVYDQQSGELAVVHASGPSAHHLRGARIPLGERLSGWVAANRRTICNSDAALDLAELPDPPRERHQSWPEHAARGW